MSRSAAGLWTGPQLTAGEVVYFLEILLGIGLSGQVIEKHRVGFRGFIPGGHLCDLPDEQAFPAGSRATSHTTLSAPVVAPIVPI